MANAYRISAGKNVQYLSAAGKLFLAKITSVTDQTHAVLAVVTSTGTRTALNGGVAVAKWTAHGQTNVWRQY